MRLLAVWARRMPASARKNKPGRNQARFTASRPATAPAVRVMGRTDARVSTSHFETGSRRPAGGLDVRSTSRQRARSPGDAVASDAVASDAVPSEAVPSEAVPSDAGASETSAIGRGYPRPAPGRLSVAGSVISQTEQSLGVAPQDLLGHGLLEAEIGELPQPALGQDERVVGPEQGLVLEPAADLPNELGGEVARRPPREIGEDVRLVEGDGVHLQLPGEGRVGTDDREGGEPGRHGVDVNGPHEVELEAGPPGRARPHSRGADVEEA